MLIQGKGTGVSNSSASSPPNLVNRPNDNTQRTHVSSRSMSTPTLPVSIPSSGNVNIAGSSISKARGHHGSPPNMFNTSVTGTSPNRNRLYHQLTPLVVPRARKSGNGGSSQSSSVGSNDGGTSKSNESSNSSTPTAAPGSIHNNQLKPIPSSSSYVAAAARYDPSTDGIGAEYIPGSVTSSFRGANSNNFMKMDADGDMNMDMGVGEGVGSIVSDGRGDNLSGAFRGERDGNGELTLGIINKKNRKNSDISPTDTPMNESIASESSFSTAIPVPHNIESTHNFKSNNSISQERPNNASTAISSEYLPDEIEFSPTIASAYMLSSPTLGLSETDWKKIPFSTRRKLKSALESGSSFTIPSRDLPVKLTGSLRSAPVTRAGSMSNTSVANTDPPVWPNPSIPLPTGSAISSASSSPKQPFSRRLKERSATMYPALGHIDEGISFAGGLKRAFAASPRNPTLSRSTSLSNNSSYSESPAFQFLSKFGSLNSDSTTSGVGGIANSRNASFISGTSSPGFASSYINDSEMGEQVGSYFLGKMIGYGGFSQVREAHTIDEKTGNKLIRAVKIVKKVNSSSSIEDMERIQNEFDREVSLWKTLSHPHILQLLFVEDNEKATYCFTERITGGTLFDLVKSTRGKNIDNEALVKYIFQLGSALLYLHETKFIVHRDVKLENCLLEDIGNGQHKILLCDFGLSDYYVKSNINSRKSSNINIAGMGDGRDSLSTSPESTRSFLTSTSSGSERSMNLVIGPSETSSTLTHHHNNSSSSSSTNTSSTLKTPNSPGLRRRSTSPARMFSTGPTSITTANCGSMPYASPELLLSDTPILHPSVDMWAFGVVIYALYMGQLPWNHGIPPILRSMILKSPWDEDSMRRKVGPEMTNIVAKCLAKDQSQRYTIRDVIYQPMFAKLCQEHSEVLM